MAISESQLQIWTNAPGTTKPQATHEQIRNALGQSDALRGKNYEIYLQGSYANSTNIKGDSDVDIVVQLNSTFYYDDTNLSPVEKSLFSLSFSDSPYHWSDFRNDVQNALMAYFGMTAVRLGNKSLKLSGNDYRLNADIVPCLQHRKYNSFSLQNKEDFIEGMKFWTINENKQVINYPKVHKVNGEDKNAGHRTDQKYKDLVRIIKNMKSYLIENNNLDPKIAPSYFVECAIYNAPDGHFGSNYQTSVANVLDFLMRRCNADTLVTGSHQHYLFGQEPWQWNKNNAAFFLQEAEKLFLGSNL